MGAIKDIVDLAIQLEGRVKDRRDIDVLRQIHSLASSLQAEHAEVIERDIRVMQENAKLVSEKSELERKLTESQAEDVCIHNGIEFRRGARTRGKWAAFCPKCHMPAQDAWIPKYGSNDMQKIVSCTAKCDWRIFQQQRIEEIAKELET